MKEVIDLFYCLYENKTTIKSDWEEYLKCNVKNFKDIHFYLSLGHGIKFIPLKNDIEKLIDIKIKLGIINDELSSELKSIYG
jgi:hypothetical protein